YDEITEQLYLKGKGYKIGLHEASSGYQALAPLYIVSKYLAEKSTDKIGKQDSMTVEEKKRFQQVTNDIYNNNNLTDEQKRAAVSALASKFNKTSFINIVEEPEQNLYPTSQRKMLNSLLEFNNKTAANKLIMTTHSPYIINYLSLAVQAAGLKEKISGQQVLDRLSRIVPLDSALSASDLIIYQLNDDGTLKTLGNYEGIPRDDNYLNESLAHGNDLFDQLLEIEQGL
ncbi:MAG: ATP-binding protein, partial [Flavobacteriales bacterium]|nr:ATP-binding protein [Flavobacteriales bacterium]